MESPHDFIGRETEVVVAGLDDFEREEAGQGAEEGQACDYLADY